MQRCIPHRKTLKNLERKTMEKTKHVWVSQMGVLFILGFEAVSRNLLKRCPKYPLKNPHALGKDTKTGSIHEFKHSLL